jgi:hypothetical protein
MRERNMLRERQNSSRFMNFVAVGRAGPRDRLRHEGTCREILRAETASRNLLSTRQHMEKWGACSTGTLEALHSPFYRVPRISSKLDHL